MRLIRLTLKNWCQHAERTVDFGPGLTAIIGANGSGKSNIIGGIYWLLTGANPNPGTMEENIYQLSPQSERAEGCLAFEHEGTLYEVVRYVGRKSTPKPFLKISGVVAKTGANVVTEHLMTMLNIDVKMLQRFIIIAQGTIFGFFSEDPAERARAFQRLFDTSKSEVIWKELGAYADKLDVHDTSSQITLRRNEVESYTLQTAATRQQLQLLQVPPDYEAVQLADQQLLVTMREQMQAQQQLVLQVGQWNNLTAQANQVSADIQSQELQLGSLLATLATQTTASDEARQLLANWESNEQLRQMRQSVTQQREKIQQDLQSRQPPAEPVMPANLPTDGSQLLQLITTLQHEIARASHAVQQFSAEGVIACPTCDTPVSTLGPHIERLRSQYLPDATIRYNALVEMYQAWEAWGRSVTLYNTALSQHQAWVKSQTEALGRLVLPEQPVEVKNPDVPQEELRQRIVTADSYVQAVNQAKQGIQSLQNSLANFHGQIGLLGPIIDGLRVKASQLGDMVIDQSQLDAVQRRINVRSQQQVEHGSLTTKLSLLEGTLAVAAQALQELQAAEVVTARRRKWLGHSEELRSLFHRNAAPRFVAQRNLQRLQAAMNDCLQIFQTDFRASADEGLSFQANFLDGRQQPAPRLSFGQKVVLAIGFLVAVNSTFAAGVNLLVLDEPTAFLDEPNIKAFEPVLNRLRELASSRGLQVVIVTHEQNLRPLFESVVQL